MTNDAQAWITCHLSRPSIDEPTRDETPERLQAGDVDDKGRIVATDGTRRSVGQFWLRTERIPAARYYGWRPLAATSHGLVMVQRP